MAAVSVDSANQKILGKYHLPKGAADSLTASLHLIQLSNSLIADGYLTASLDSVSIDSTTASGHYYVGPEYKWGNVSINTGQGEFNYLKPNQKIDYQTRFRGIIQKLNNEGYPFARVGFDSVNIVAGKINGVMTLERGPLINFDTIQVTPQSPARTKFLAKYLRIEAGRYYNERLLRQIPKRISNLSYYELASPISLLFHNNHAQVSFEVEKIRVNRFDGIIGVLPNAGSAGKTLVTGEVDLSLQNLFEAGYGFDINWRKMREESQSLNLNMLLPKVFNSPIDIIGSFHQLKEDTTFVNRDARVSGRVELAPGINFNVFVNFKNGGLLGETQELNESLSPFNADFNLNTYGIGLSVDELNQTDLFNSGFYVRGEFSLGNKKINRNPVFDDEVYESLELESAQYQFEGEFVGRKVIGKKLQFFERFTIGAIINDNIFKNDMFRLGGAQSLRGFNENFFFATNYALSRSELRFFYEESSFFFSFFDQAWVAFKQDNLVANDFPFGFGAGVQFGTPTGDFVFSYALGVSDDVSLQFNQSKIHFGIVSRF
ncbi:MAG: hypothetical protein RJQ09_03150 [Cyclobacteriaceae bacterium]